MSKVGVIGATGFIGSQLVEHLLEQGEDVVCLLRENSDASFLSTLPCALRRTAPEDWRDPAALATRFEGLDRVYNCSSAGAGHQSMAYWREHEVERTRRIASAAAAAALRRFLQLSTVWYHGSKLPGRITEAHKPTALYGPVRMFVEREDAVRQVSDATGLVYTIVRPASVIAARDARSFIARLLQAYRVGRMPLFDGGRHVVALSDGRDLADAMHRLSLDSMAANETYLHKSYEVTYQDLRSAFSDVVGEIAQRRLPPTGVVMALAGIAEALTPRGRPLELTRFAIAALSQDVRIDDAKLRALGIAPRFDFAASQKWALAGSPARGEDRSGAAQRSMTE